MVSAAGRDGAGPSAALLEGTVEETDRVDDEPVLVATAFASCVVVGVGALDPFDEPQPTSRHNTTAALTERNRICTKDSLIT